MSYESSISVASIFSFSAQRVVYISVSIKEKR
jgi:hypothetical protein